MHILAFILMFVFGAIGAALEGDFSGTIFIGKVLIGIGAFLFLACLFTGFSTEGCGTIVLISIGMAIFGGILAAKEF